MKKTLLVALTAVMLGVVACGDSSPTAVSTPAPQFELIDEDLQIGEDATHYIYATFLLELGNGSGDGVITNHDLALFPGKPKHGPGTCYEGMWFNPQEKPTSGSREKPHPFCFDPEAAGGGMKIVLERISGIYEENRQGSKFLFFGRNDSGDLDDNENTVKFISNSDNQQGNGIIEAWAINEATEERVGRVTFDLATFQDGPSSDDLFDCDLGSEITSDGCLNREIDDAVFHWLVGWDNGDPIFDEDNPEDVPSGFIYWLEIE